MNIFSSIWKKHHKLGVNPVKLAEDTGALRGVFGYKEYDAKTGQFISDFQTHNLLVNSSKSNIIRLISQGTSPWKGTLSADSLKISRMRFGNHNPTGGITPNKLDYYDFYELSSRPKTLQTSDIINNEKNNTGYNPNDNIISTVTRSTTQQYNVPYSQAVTSPYIVTCPKPPSHGTLIVEIFNGNTLVETITFANAVYTRASDGIVPTKIKSVSGTESTWITTPATRDANFETVPTSITTKTRLVYSYSSGFEGWKLILGEIDPNTARFTQIRFKFKIGLYNVINSIVPQTGYNNAFTSSTWDGQMAEIPNRYLPATSQKDYYSILSNPEYRDSEADYVDDYSVTFACNMSGNYGNGGLASGDTVNAIKYKEAFLFNGLDDMFSHVVLPSTFDKNESNAFYVSWTILAPIN